MKILVISDSHRNIANLKHVMGFAKEIKAGAVVHAGDWNNLKSLETVLDYKIPLYTVLGNADIDPEVCKNLKKYSKKFGESFLVTKIAGMKVGIVHKLKVIDYGVLKGLDVVFTGHYHSQKEWIIDGIKIIRPGALENSINFAIFDTENKKVELINHDKI